LVKLILCIFIGSNLGTAENQSVQIEKISRDKDDEMQTFLTPNVAGFVKNIGLISINPFPSINISPLCY
jgi:hypothetical protein